MEKITARSPTGFSTWTVMVSNIYCGILQGCLRMTTTALQQLTICIAHSLVVRVYSGERVVERCALVSRAEVLLISQVQAISFYLVRWVVV